MRVVALAAAAVTMILACCAPVRAAVLVEGTPEANPAVAQRLGCVSPGLVAMEIGPGPLPSLPVEAAGLPCPSPTWDPCPHLPVQALVAVSMPQEVASCVGGGVACPEEPPRQLRAEAQGKGVLLSWDPPPGGAPELYRLYRVVDLRPGEVVASTAALTDLPGDRTSFLDESAGAGADAVYWMTSVGMCEGRPSNYASSGHVPPTVSDCVYPDFGLYPWPHLDSIYVGLDCLGVPNPGPVFPIILRPVSSHGGRS